MNRLVNLFHQSLLIFKWIDDFETSPPKITGMFSFDGDIKMMNVPGQLKQWETLIKSEISNVGNLQLSPSDKNVND